MDTGTSLLTAPSQDFKKLREVLDLDDSDSCQHYRSLPDLIFVIDGEEYAIKAEDYVITVTEYGEEDPGNHSEDWEYCSEAIMSLDVG